jgi:hypothetical protein
VCFECQRKDPRAEPKAGFGRIAFLNLSCHFVNGNILGAQGERATLVYELCEVLDCANDVEEELLRDLLAGIWVGPKPIVLD